MRSLVPPGSRPVACVHKWVEPQVQLKTQGLAVMPDEQRRSRIIGIIGQAQTPPVPRGPRGTADTDLRSEAGNQNVSIIIKNDDHELRMHGKEFY